MRTPRNFSGLETFQVHRLVSSLGIRYFGLLVQNQTVRLPNPTNIPPNPASMLLWPQVLERTQASNKVGPDDTQVQDLGQSLDLGDPMSCQLWLRMV